MKFEIGEVVEIVYVVRGNITITVFGEVLGFSETRLRMSVWEGPAHIQEYDEVNILRKDILDKRSGGSVEDALDDLLDPLH